MSRLATCRSVVFKQASNRNEVSRLATCRSVVSRQVRGRYVYSLYGLVRNI